MKNAKFQGKTILIVDDNESQLKAMESYFNLNKAKVFISTNSNEAMEIVKNNKIDHIVCDFNLEGDNAFSILDKIKMFASKPNFFIMSGDLDLSQELCFSKGASGLLKKPFNLSHLDKIIEKTLLDLDSFKKEKLEIFLMGDSNNNPFKVKAKFTTMDDEFLIVLSEGIVESMDVKFVEIVLLKTDDTEKKLILQVSQQESIHQEDDMIEIHYKIDNIPEEWRRLIQIREDKQRDVNSYIKKMKGVA